MDRTTKKALGYTSEPGKKGRNFKSTSDAIDGKISFTAIKHLHARVNSGDPEAVKEFLDRYYGKAAQSLDMTSDGDKIQAPIINVTSAEQQQKILDFNKTLDAI